MPRVRLQVLLVASLACLAAGKAQALVDCTLTVVAPAFGTYDPTNASPTTVNGSVRADCTWISGGTQTVNLVASYSKGNSASYASRYMLSGVNQLNYNLYTTTTYTTIRGDGTAGTATGNASLTVSAGSPTASITGVLAGRIPAGQNAVPGSYADTIVITMTY
jgi:spore coat protein U-like protein